MVGSYVLVVRLPQKASISIGSLGQIDFKEGCYAYVGSALNGLESRIRRHLSDRKKTRRHIDYLLILKEAQIKHIFYVESSERWECGIAKELSRCLTSVKGFGCSDCKCSSHLFYDKSCKQVAKAVLNLGGGGEHQWKMKLWRVS